VTVAVMPVGNDDVNELTWQQAAVGTGVTMTVPYDGDAPLLTNAVEYVTSP
jgi:hypothetical protein